MMYLQAGILPLKVISQRDWSAAQNIIYLLIVLGTLLVTLGVVWLVRRFGGGKVAPVVVNPRHEEIKLIFEETLSASDRVVVRDNQVIEAVKLMPKDPALAEPLQAWRDKRREWAGELAFLESLGKTPSAEMLTDPANASSLRQMHSLAEELEASQRTMLRAIRQSIAMGTENPPLGTDSDD